MRSENKSSDRTCQPNLLLHSRSVVTSDVAVITVGGRCHLYYEVPGEMFSIVSPQRSKSVT